MASTRTICTECKSVVTLPEPAEVGDVVPCPKCESYFAVPRTKIVPTPGAAKPAAPAKPAAVAPKPKAAVASELPAKKKPVVVVEDDGDEDDEEEERPKKKKSSGDGPRKKKRKKKNEEKSFKDSPVRYAILGVLVLIMLVGGFLLYKKMMKGDPPEIVVKSTILDDGTVIYEDGRTVPPPNQKPAPTGSGGPRTGLPSVDRTKAMNELQQLGRAYHNYFGTHNKPPKTPDDLQDFVENRQELIKSIKDGVYVIFMDVNFTQLPDGATNTVLGYVHDVPQKGGVVLFADGSVRNIPKYEFDDAPKAGK